MIRRISNALALVLVATPLLVAGCGGGGGTGTGNDGSTDGITIVFDAAGAGGSPSDGAIVPDVVVPADGPAADAPAVDGRVVDLAVGPDAAQPVDTTAGDTRLGVDAPVTPDTAQKDVATLDASVPDLPDTAPAADTKPAIDLAPAIDTTPPPVGCTETVKFTGGAVNSSRTLTKACSPYTIKTDIAVNGNATLTIEPGVTLAFDADKKLAVGATAAGKLVAVGTEDEPIVFTSSNDTPGAGDWMGIQFLENTMNGSSIACATVGYCGSNRDACVFGAQGVKPNRVSLTKVAFSNVGSGADAIWERDADSNFAISGCTFSDIPTTPTQQYAINVQAPSFIGIDGTNVFNDGAMIDIDGGIVSTTTTWKNLGTPIAVTSELRVEGPTTPVLTIAAGSILKFGAGVDLSVGYGDRGSLVLAGTNIISGRVTLTSLASTPAAGDWIGIVLWNAGTAKISNAVISYAGGNAGAIAVDTDQNSLDIQNSTINDSAGYGIAVHCGSTASITNKNNTFTNIADENVGPGPNGPTCN